MQGGVTLAFTRVSLPLLPMQTHDYYCCIRRLQTAATPIVLLFHSLQPALPRMHCIRPCIRLALARATSRPASFSATASPTPAPTPWPEAYSAKCFVVCADPSLPLYKTVTPRADTCLCHSRARKSTTPSSTGCASWAGGALVLRVTLWQPWRQAGVEFEGRQGLDILSDAADCEEEIVEHFRGDEGDARGW